MPVDHVTVTFSRDQAFVLSHWLDEQLGTRDFDRLVDRDPVVWSAIYLLTGLLNDDPVIFASDYGDQLAASRARLREQLGEDFIASRTNDEPSIDGTVARVVIREPGVDGRRGLAEP